MSKISFSVSVVIGMLSILISLALLLSESIVGFFIFFSLSVLCILSAIDDLEDIFKRK